MDDIREDSSSVPLLVFFPVKPRTHYMVSGRVEKRHPGEVGSLDEHEDVLRRWESSAYR